MKKIWVLSITLVCLAAGLKGQNRYLGRQTTLFNYDLSLSEAYQMDVRPANNAMLDEDPFERNRQLLMQMAFRVVKQRLKLEMGIDLHDGRELIQSASASTETYPLTELYQAINESETPFFAKLRIDIDHKKFDRSFYEKDGEKLEKRNVAPKIEIELTLFDKERNKLISVDGRASSKFELVFDEQNLREDFGKTESYGQACLDNCVLISRLLDKAVLNMIKRWKNAG
ncbi:MAG: hypothetical protein AAF206_32175 [Bacteroidota bacterium]